MSEFHQRSEIITNTSSGTVAAGATKVLYRIPRRSNRRLEKIEIHANITLGAGMAAGTATNRLEGFLSEVRFSASDIGTASRQIFKQGSATLLAWHYKHARQSCRYNATSYRAAAAGTYDILVPLHLSHPASPSPQAFLMSLPMWAQDATGVGLGADPELELDFAALNDANLGLTGGTYAINFVRILLYFRDIPSGALPYVPTVLQSTQFDTGTAGGTGIRFTYAKDGFLTSSLLENFSTPATGVRGSVLTAAADYWKWRYKGGDLDERTPVQLVHEDDLDTVQGAISAANNVPDTIYSRNFWHDSPHREARRLNSCPNLYDSNGGDLLTIEGTSVAASRRLLITDHRVLVSNPAILAEA